MKKTFKSLLVIATTSILLIGCESYDFGSTGVDTNNPVEAIPSSLLTGAQSKLVGTVSLSGTATPSLYVQHLSQTQYTEESRYQTINFNWNAVGSGGGFDGSVNFYNKVLINLAKIIELNTNEDTKADVASYGSNNNQIAVAKLMWAYYFQWATDRWGMLPYSEAFGGVSASKAKYDSQEEIYDDLFTKIDEALAQMDNGAGPQGDILFSGDMTLWAKFGQTLKMNMAIRLAKVYPSSGGYAATKFNQAMAGSIASVSENIMFPSISNDAYDNPYQDDYVDLGRADECLSDVLVNRMDALNDPRLPMFGEPAITTGTFVGLRYGWEGAGSVPNDDVSFMNDDLIKNGERALPMYTFAQISFNKAEAALLGWISGSSQAYYEEAIAASMAQWGVSSADSDAYLLEADIVYDAANAMNQIAEQKWLALFYQPYEAWAEWRRLDYPVLTPAVDALLGNSIPVRHGYPAAERNQNQANYEAAVAAQGADGLFTKLWWDVN
ncbi:SusD/RagB family nutrient-binding outer membrane lipoprotein [Polaribacter sp. IC063]|uniref:SusD/RagB family nutrient-binding outer membrane lipoprotein n=1 Tax=Polaribacter sp. IC063 TaxID=57031 RepID=UPI0011BDF789|nr:SusD/RagB family nutrient-binding outer membrane lipoprotein [Polaribacter sp. IC063]TXD54301.1 SusD/RagB family nutrient-binding outer membrane lipoprotein [Polaribacter sp. IC063]